MKRVLSLGLIVLFFLCGCQEPEEVYPVTNDITFLLKIEYYNEKYTLNCKRDKNGETTFSVLIPTELKGYRLILNGKEITAKYKGLEYTPKEESFFTYDVAATVYRIINSIDTTKKLKFKEGKNSEINSSIDKVDFCFVFSPAGLPLSIRVPEKELNCVFSAVKINSAS